MSETSATPSPSPETTTISDANSIQAQNRGPITTLFNPPASCTATLTTQQPTQGSGMFFGHSWDPYLDPSCFPLGTKAAADLVPTLGPWQDYYYSPAICPKGWSAATTFGSDIPGGDTTVFFYNGPETTAALCCPSGYDYAGLGHLCSSTLTRNQRVPYISPTSTGNGWDPGSASTTTMAAGSTVFGDGVPIRWQVSDEALLSAATTLSESSTAQTSSSEQTTSTTASPTNTSLAHGGGGLSTGAKAGIGVGVAAFILAAGIATAVLFRRRRKRKQKSYPDTQMLPELLGIPGPAHKYGHKRPEEMPVPGRPAELY